MVDALPAAFGRHVPSDHLFPALDTCPVVTRGVEPPAFRIVERDVRLIDSLARSSTARSCGTLAIDTGAPRSRGVTAVYRRVNSDGKVASTEVVLRGKAVACTGYDRSSGIHYFRTGDECHWRRSLPKLLVVSHRRIGVSVDAEWHSPSTARSVARICDRGTERRTVPCDTGSKPAGNPGQPFRKFTVVDARIRARYPFYDDCRSVTTRSNPSGVVQHR